MLRNSSFLQTRHLRVRELHAQIRHRLCRTDRREQSMVRWVGRRGGRACGRQPSHPLKIFPPWRQGCARTTHQSRVTSSHKEEAKRRRGGRGARCCGSARRPRRRGGSVVCMVSFKTIPVPPLLPLIRGPPTKVSPSVRLSSGLLTFCGIAWLWRILHHACCSCLISLSFLSDVVLQPARLPFTPKVRGQTRLFFETSTQPSSTHMSAMFFRSPRSINPYTMVPESSSGRGTRVRRRSSVIPFFFPGRRGGFISKER